MPWNGASNPGSPAYVGKALGVALVVVGLALRARLSLAGVAERGVRSTIAQP